MSEFRILLVEDDAGLREALRCTLVRHGYDVTCAADGEQALEAVERQPFMLVLSDVQMQPMSGLELLARLQEDGSRLPVVLMTAYGSVPQAVDAIRHGALDYLVKPIESDALLEMVARFREVGRPDGELVTEDPLSRKLAAMAERVAAADVNVLLSGPSGSGKEAFARFIHRRSRRADRAFVAVNCAAIPDQMLEAELFGHERGAFTGAVQSRAGKFECANGGTLLLDEISEMDLALQAKLLRVLQECQVERLGANRLIDLDVRVIATTNRDLPAAVAEGDFREDLFYRLNVFPLRLPSLRDRPGDILPLAQRSLQRHARQAGVVPTLDEAAARLLYRHDWPGNVRELDNVIQRALVLAEGHDRITASHLFFSCDAEVVGNAEPEAESATGTLQAQVEQREYRTILAALREHGGHRGRAAERLGISPRTLRYKLSRMRRDGIEIPGDTGRALASSP
jgi:two-component system response regulator FlrC